MKTFLECIPCFVGQALKAARLVSNDEKIHEVVLRTVLCEAGKMDLSVSPPAMGQKIHRLIRQIVGDSDPYALIKTRSNQAMLKLYPQLKTRIEAAADPFDAAVRLAIAGNIIDYAINAQLEEAEIRQTCEDALTVPIAQYPLNEFGRAIEQAETILYLADNAGEIVLDRLLIERMPREKVTLVVRGEPVINDATVDDARAAGLIDLVEVIDNGSDAPGTILESCSESFRRRFGQADLIVAKGQGNYETLGDVEKDIFHLFKVKCPVIGRDAGANVGDLILRRNTETCPGRLPPAAQGSTQPTHR